MTTIKDVRQEVADIVTDATTIPAFPFFPGRLIVPSAVVMPGSPYVESGLTFGSLQIRYQVELVMGTANNEVTASGLDAQIQNAIVGFINAGYSVEGASAPYALEANGQQYLASTITVTNSLRP